MIKNEGFTLIEVVVTLLILTVGLLGMAALTVSVIQRNAQSNKITTATTLAQDKLEEMKTIGSSIVDDEDPYDTIPGYPAFKRVTEVAENTPNLQTSMVTVTVYWTVNWDSKDHSVALSTIISE